MQVGAAEEIIGYPATALGGFDDQIMTLLLKLPDDHQQDKSQTQLMAF
jgi:hypothetical protein